MALDPMKGMIASYLASPRGKQAIGDYLSSPEGKKTISEYFATTEGRQLAKQILPAIFVSLGIPPEKQAIILEGVCCES